MIEKLVADLNEWWVGSIAKEKVKEYRRELFPEIINLMDLRQIVMITGLRRVGKTTLIFQIINELLKFTDPKKIFYFSFDVYKNVKLYDLLDTYTKITGIDWRKEKVYLFFDEIQKLKNWSSEVKLVYDNFPNVKIVLSGSASLLLEKEASENLAGRYFARELPVLNIKEYYEIKNRRKVERFELVKRDLELEFFNYVKKPFPEIVNYEERLAKEYVRELIISKIVKSDIIEAFKKVDVSIAEKLFMIFLSNPGMILNLDNLSKDLKIHKKTLEKYLYILQFSKLIRVLKNYRPSFLSASRKLRKVYPYDISLSLAYFNVENSKIFETKIISQLNLGYYWKIGNKELNGIYFLDNKMVPIEIKYKEKIGKEEIKNVKYFMKKYKVEKGVVIYLGENAEMENVKLVNYLDACFHTNFETIV